MPDLTVKMCQIQFPDPI